MIGQEEKNYRKKSMIFLQSLVNQIKKTKVFKSLVEKQAKEKLREEIEKQHAKEIKYQQKMAGSVDTKQS
jgi:hypothetical protein